MNGKTESRPNVKRCQQSLIHNSLSKPRIREPTTKRVMTEETKSSEFAALLKGKHFPSGVTGDVPYTTQAASPTGLSGLEEAALQFIYDQQKPAHTTPALQLVAKDDEKREAKELEELKPLKQFYIKQIEDLIKNAIDPNVIAALQEVLKEISSAKDSGSISAALANAPSAASAAMAKVETPEQRVDKLWGSIDKLNKEINEDLAKIDHLMTPEQQKRRKKLEEEVQKAKEEEERLRADPNSEEYKRAHRVRIEKEQELAADKEAQAKGVLTNPHTTSEEKDAARAALEKLAKLQQELEQAEKKALRAAYPTLSEDGIEQKIADNRKDRNEIYSTLEKGGDVQKIQEVITRSEVDLKGVVERLNAPQSSVSSQITATANPKYTFAEASRADPKAPSTTPADDFDTSAGITQR